METRTYNPNTDFNSIANELSYRVGRPNLKNEEHLGVLVEILKEAGWSNTAITYFIRNIIIAEATPIAKQPSSKKVKIYVSPGEKPPKGKKVVKGDRGGTYYIGSPEEKVKVDREKSKKQTTRIHVDKKSAQPSPDVPTSQKKPVKQAPVKPEVQVDKSGNYVPSEQDRKIVNTAMSSATTKGAMMVKDTNKKLLSQFENDVQKLMATRNPKLATDMVAKYKIGTNIDAEIGQPSKLYLRALENEGGLKAYKLFSGGVGNTASTIIARILKDAGALGDRGGFTRKSMTANKIFTDKQELKVSRDKNKNIIIGDHKLLRAKKYDYDNIKRLFIQKGLSPEKAKAKSNELKKRVNRHNFILDNIENILGKSSLNVLRACEKCDVNTPEGIQNTKKMTIKKIIDKMTSLSRGKITPGVKKIISGFNDLNNIKDKKQYQLKLNDILYEFSMDKNTTATSADITEMVDYLRVLNSGSPAYLPEDSNFALGDILKLPSKQPTIKEIMEADDISSVFVSLEDRSVKKGTGGPSASKGKIQLTKFKNKDTQSDLMKISDNYDALINKKDTKSADKLISALEKKYSEVLKNDSSYIKRINNKDTWIKATSKKLHNIDIWNRYYKLGYMMQTIYNNNIDFQAFQNSKYDVKKKGVEHDLSDGINIIAKLGFEPSMIGPNGKPLNQYPTRFYHHKK